MGKVRSYLKSKPIMISCYQTYVRYKGKMRYYFHKLSQKPLSEEDLIAQFPKMGIYPKDKIVINLSMSKIGILKDGAKTLIRALQCYITEEGLIVMPTYPHRDCYNYLESEVVFDVLNTPSKNGLVTEEFRKMDGVFRSIHPTHPLAAWGKDAKKLMEGHELSKSMYDEKSPYKKLLDLNVKNVLIGVNFDHMIMIRIIDDLYTDYPIDPYCKKRYHVKVKGYQGEELFVETNCHDPHYFSLERANMKMYPYMKDKIVEGKLGNADTWVLNSQEMYKIQIECASKGIYAFNKLRFKDGI